MGHIMTMMGRNKEQESILSIYFIRDRTHGKGHWTFSKQ